MTVTLVRDNRNRPPPIRYTMICRRCKSVFTYNESDCTVPQQNPMYIQCPACDGANWHKDHKPLRSKRK